jgi:NADH dehydrogenase
VQRVVILGGGFAGAYCAQALERRSKGMPLDILLLDRHNYFIFYPLLVEAGTGSVEPRHAVVSIRAFLRSASFKMADVVSLDAAARTIQCRIGGEAAPQSIPYDHLVLALGSHTRLPDVAGLARHAQEMKSLTDAVWLRDRAIQHLEEADATQDASRRKALLRFVVVGGNFTGVEVAGELQVFLHKACRRYRNVRRDEIGITLVELAARILPALDSDLAEYAARRLRGRGIELRLNASLTSVQEDRVVFTTGEELPCRSVIWCAGIQP